MGASLYQKWLDEEAIDLEKLILHHGINGLLAEFENWVVGKQPEKNSYFCVVCGRHLPIVDGVVVHDNIDHPKDMVFEPEAEKKHSHLISPTGC